MGRVAPDQARAEPHPRRVVASRRQRLSFLGRLGEQGTLRRHHRRERGRRSFYFAMDIDATTVFQRCRAHPSRCRSRNGRPPHEKSSKSGTVAGHVSDSSPGGAGIWEESLIIHVGQHFTFPTSMGSHGKSGKDPRAPFRLPAEFQHLVVHRRCLYLLRVY